MAAKIWEQRRIRRRFNTGLKKVERDPSAVYHLTPTVVMISAERFFKK